MEPVSHTAGAVVAALVLKGAQKAGETVTEVSLVAIRRLVDHVRARFRDRVDAAAEKALARVEDPPAGLAQLQPLRPACRRAVRGRQPGGGGHGSGLTGRQAILHAVGWLA